MNFVIFVEINAIVKMPAAYCIQIYNLHFTRYPASAVHKF